MLAIPLKRGIPFDEHEAAVDKAERADDFGVVSLGVERQCVPNHSAVEIVAFRCLDTAGFGGPHATAQTPSAIRIAASEPSERVLNSPFTLFGDRNVASSHDHVDRMGHPKRSALSRITSAVRRPMMPTLMVVIGHFHL